MASPCSCYKHLHLILIIIASATASIYPAKASIVEGDSLQHLALDSIIVTGVKYTNNQFKLPVSASSVSQKYMQAVQLREVKDFSAYVPNFVMIDRDTRLTSSVFVRGIGSLINAPGVAMYVDGIPHFEKSSFDINLANVEKVEFLRGPQGTLYGRNAIGGIILVHTQSPFKYKETKLNMRYGAFGETYAMISRSDKINDKLGYTVSADYNRYGGFIRNTYNDEMADKLNSASLNTRLEWRPQVNLNFRLTNNFDYSDQGAFTYGEVDAETNTVETVSLNHPSKYNRKLYDGGLRMDYHTNLLWLYTLTSVQLLDDRYDVDQDGSAADMYYAIQSEKQRLFAQEVNLKNLYSDVYSWHFGLFFFNHAIDRNTDVQMNMTNPQYKLEKVYDDYSRGISAYHQSSLNMGEKFTLEAGIRYDREKANSVHHEYKIVDGTSTMINEFDSPATFSQWTPKASLQYKATRNGHIYATVSKGYKSGGFNTVFDTPDERAFGPESSWNYEIGAKTSLFDNHLQLEAAIFHIDLKDQQVRQQLSERGVKVYNAGKSRNRGVELSLRANPIKALQLWAAYGLTDARFIEYTAYNSATRENEDYAGKRAPYVPRNTVSAGGQYDILFSPANIIDKLSFTCNYKGLGQIYWHENNAAQQAYYGLLDAQISATKKRVELSLWARNITDADYIGYSFELAGRRMGKPGKPRSGGVSITYRF